VPKTRSYRVLHDRVVARPGATERIAAQREEALAEMGLHELRVSQEHYVKSLWTSNIRLALMLAITGLTTFSCLGLIWGLRFDITLLPVSLIVVVISVLPLPLFRWLSRRDEQ
jgi:membrane protein required for beta-lactamase induction